MEQKIKDRLKSFLGHSLSLGGRGEKLLDWLEFLRGDEVEEFLSSIFEDFKTEAQDILYYNDLGRAREMAAIFDSLIRQYVKKNSKLFTDYQEILRQLQFKAFPLLSFQEHYDLVREAAIWALKKNLEFKAILNEYLMEWTADSPANNFAERKALAASLEQNEELIGDPRLKINLIQESIAKPTVKNWLINYQNQIGGGESGLSIATFLTKNQAVRDLKEEERTLLEQILSLYFWLRNPLSAVAEFKVEEASRPRVVAASTPARAAGRATPEGARPSLLDEVLLKIKRGEFTPKNFAAYLKVVLPKPIDFKQVVILANELKRQGYPQFMDIVYFDPADGQYHWSE